MLSFIPTSILLLLSASPLASVLAQSASSSAVTPSTSALPPCALSCTVQAAGASTCGGITNVTCLCTNTAFEAAAFSCYKSTCSASDYQIAATYGAQLCAQAGAPINISAIPTGVSSTAAPSGTASMMSSMSAPASTSMAGSATGLVHGLKVGQVVGGAVVAGLVVVGSVIVGM